MPKPLRISTSGSRRRSSRSAASIRTRRRSDPPPAKFFRGPIPRTRSSRNTFATAANVESSAQTRSSKGSQFMSARTVRLHRVLRSDPDHLYRAFLDADAMSKWLPPYGFTCKVHHLDAKVGGTFRMSFTNFTTGNGHSFGGAYQQLVPNELIRYAERFDDPHLPGEMETTVTLRRVWCGAELNVVQELSLIHISEPTRLLSISYAVFCL